MGRAGVERGQQFEIDVLSARFITRGSVGDLVCESSAVAFVGGEEGAAFADRLVCAVE